MGVRPSCAVILVRSQEDCREVFLVKRASSQKFYPHFYAFPGGALEESDREIPLEGCSAELRQEIVGAVREVFEETGLLLTQPTLPVKKLADLRKKLLRGDLSLSEILRQKNLQICSQSLVPLGRKTTPSFYPIRYQTRFFWTEVAPDQECEIWPGELEEGLWIAPSRVLELWKTRKMLIPPPVLVLLRLMESGKEVDSKITKMRKLDDQALQGQAFRIPFDPSCEMVPLRTPTVPPATHTNCFLIGQKAFYILDPGPSDSEEQDRFCRVIDEKIQEGSRPVALLLSHYHPDHLGAAQLLKERYSLPIYAHRLTPDLLAEKDIQVDIDHFLEDGQILNGADTGPLKVVFTPGHAPDHCCFFIENGRLLFGGDMVSTISSVVIPPPPKGDLGAYLESLHHLLDLQPAWLFPSHGSPTARAVEKIQAYIRHRQNREIQLVDALKRGKQDVDQLVSAVYAGFPLSPPAEILAKYNVQSGLSKLVEEGKVTVEEEKYFLS